MIRIKKVKRVNLYPDELKRKIAQEYLSGRFNYAVAAEEYGLRGKSVVREFVKWFRRNNDLSAINTKISISKKLGTTPDSAQLAT